MRATILKRIAFSKALFLAVSALFVISLGFTVCGRGGKDLKVGLYGVHQVFEKASPYSNPLDPARPIFRYAPGFAIMQYPFTLKASPVSPYQFKGMTPSILAWYLITLLCLAASALILLDIIPCASRQISERNMRLALLMALPFIGYELSNGQNKIVALFFMLSAILFFKRGKLFLCALMFCAALTVYIALFPFVLYFALRKKRFATVFAAACVVVFIIIPSVFIGFDFNIFLLKDWFARSLKPFFMASSYANYIDLRNSSQSLPSAIGRIFSHGRTNHFLFLIPPAAIHLIIRAMSAAIVFLTCLAVYKGRGKALEGLGYSAFLLLALILPQYCIYYTWAWLFVFYFCSFNYISDPDVTPRRKNAMAALTLIIFASGLTFGVRVLNHASVIFWGTLVFWAGLIVLIMSKDNEGAQPV